MPGIVVALALVTVSIRTVPALYQTLSLLLLGYAILFLPRGVVSVRATLELVPPGLEDVARTLGCTGPAAAARVTLPLLVPGLAASAALVALAVSTELHGHPAALAPGHHDAGHPVLVRRLLGRLRRRRAVRPRAGAALDAVHLAAQPAREGRPGVTALEIRGLGAAYGAQRVLARPRPGRRGRRHRDPRAVGLRQDDAAAGGRRLRDSRPAGPSPWPARPWWATGAPVPPRRRALGYVPQEGALFPHLSVAANIAFGLPRAQRRAPATVGRVAEVLDLVELPRRWPSRQPARAVGRSAAASRAGPGAGSRTGAGAAGRAVLVVGRRAAGGDRPGGGPCPARDRGRRGARHPRPGRGAVAGRPGRGDARRLLLSRSGPRHAVYLSPADADVASFIGHASLLHRLGEQRRHRRVRARRAADPRAVGRPGWCKVAVRGEQVLVLPADGEGVRRRGGRRQLLRPRRDDPGASSRPATTCPRGRRPASYRLPGPRCGSRSSARSSCSGRVTDDRHAPVRTSSRPRRRPARRRPGQRRRSSTACGASPTASSRRPSRAEAASLGTERGSCCSR